MATRKRKEGFVGSGAMGDIGLEQSFDRLRRVLCLEVVVDLLPDVGVRTEPAAGEEMITLHRVLLVDRHARPDQADVADVMLGTGMVAAGNVDVDRLVHLAARLAPVADLGSVALGVGGGKAATGIASAGDQAGADMRRLDREPDLLDRRNGKLDILVTLP